MGLIDAIDGIDLIGGFVVFVDVRGLMIRLIVWLIDVVEWLINFWPDDLFDWWVWCRLFFGPND